MLSWLLDEPGSEAVREALAGAELVVASDLTLVECERALIRASVLGEMAEADAADRRGVLRHAAAHWVLLRVDDEIAERAKRPLPGEPIRTLDALHLASLLVGRTAVPGLALVSLDRRIRGSAAELGVEVWPPDS